ncbi:hypothetical protein UFOVP126_6 [uncultured Caudovirales phage]|uniref:Peptidase S74 domain-containing protein n=1 Tax=uncultured Caudovirales phage TaxID=2100421 RepID=A0A6J5L878_9CAUD|nr:hypothetical protein UFOVP126_6 [uncultured Caudovirales phage]
MSAPGFTPISLYYSTTAAATPSAGNLANGELAVNITDGKLFYKDNGGVVQVLATKGAGTIGGSTTQVQYNNAGVLAGSANLTFDGTTLTANALTVSNAVTFSGGTANGVAYLNGSKVLTTGSALTFDGSALGVAGRASLTGGGLTGSGNGMHLYFDTGSNTGFIKGFHAGVDDRAIRIDGLNLQFAVAGSEQMRLTSTGLGIGTSSITDKLTVQGSGNFRVASGNVGVALSGASWSYSNYFNAADNSLRWYSSTGGDRIVLDSSGNLGLGVTPSAWSGGGNAQFQKLSFAGTDYSLGSNYYQTAGSIYRYASTDTAAKLSFYNGQFLFYTAPSGTAGNAISFTQAMTLDASGNLLVGGTSNAVGARAILENASGNQLGLRYTGIATWYNSIDSSGNYIWTKDGSEKARIDSSGNLLVGTTTRFSTERVSINQTVAGAQALYTKNLSGDFNFNCWNAATSGDNQFIQFITEASPTSRGSITYNRGAGLVAYNVTSDYRAKDIIGPVVDSGALIDSVPVYMGKMKGATQERPMFIAHEVPAYAHTGEKDAVDADGKPVYQQMDASALVPVMWAEIQSLRKRLAAAGI